MRNSLLNKILNILLSLTYLSLISCSSYRNITIDNKLTVEAFIAEIAVEEDYAFTLKSGKILYIHINKIDSAKVFGVARDSKRKDMPSYLFEDSHEGLYRNVIKIDQLKFDPLLTFISSTIFIGIPIIFLIDYASHPFY